MRKGILDKKPIETLETEVKAFADSLPYWTKYLAEKLLSGNTISDDDIEKSYLYLLEDLQLRDETKKPEILLNYSGQPIGDYKPDLFFTHLQNIEGVNALIENQTIEFSPNVTILYGANGSGKSGYVRLLKKSFYSKAPEEILHNIYIDRGHKPVSGEFAFRTDGGAYWLKYPENTDSSEFRQFAVFDGKSVLKHLENRNEFEFRPAGLSFFAEFTEAFNEVEELLNKDIQKRNNPNYFIDLFEGESEIKKFIITLSARTDIAYLKKYIPYSKEDIEAKKKVEKEHDELLLSIKNKDKQIRELEKIKGLIESCKQGIISINKYFGSENLSNIEAAITDCLKKEKLAKKEGVDNFTSEIVKDIGGPEWKAFIQAAEKFAVKQKENSAYPEKDDVCILCHQPLSKEAVELITQYWKYLKSQAEQDAKNANGYLLKIKKELEKINFELFPPDNLLTVWLDTNFKKVLDELKEKLTGIEKLAGNLIANIDEKSAIIKEAAFIDTSQLDKIILDIDANVKSLKENEQIEKLEKLKSSVTYYIHKEKLSLHYDKIEKFVADQKWILLAGKFNWASLKLSTTKTEKRLSEKYFNEKYVELFNKECSALNGDFHIDVDSRSAKAKSNRQLFIRGNLPSVILSEGEQKVIAIADFLSEMQLSEVNRGLIFDDPVNSLDEKRMKEIACRLTEEGMKKQVIIFTHDLIFVSDIIILCEDNKIPFVCHWVENNGEPGQIWLNNTPSHEKEYRNSDKPTKHYSDAKKEDCPPAKRENLIKDGFGALRTCYEVLVISDLFENVVQRFNERVSIDSLKKVRIDESIVNELMDNFAQCCRYMEGHTHSDKYAYKKPGVANLLEEIQRYDALRTKIRKIKKEATK
jgi:hypothetical protein